MKILLIAGHGAGDPGASGKLDGVTYREADETRNVVNLLAAELKKRGVESIVYDQGKNAYKEHLAGKLNFPPANYLLEVHFNAVSQGKEDGKTKGVECYVTANEAGISVETEICKSLSSLGLTNRGVKRKNFAVITAGKKAGISSALLETCFIDDPDDLRLYVARREAFAKAIADGICNGFGIRADKPEAETAMEWAVQKGLFKGDGQGNFRWNDPPTRKELAIVLHRMRG